MFLTDLFHIAFSVQSDPDCYDCSSTALKAIAAAFTTQGFYLQADILDQITYFGLGTWAIVAYVFAAIGALISVALGTPPKNYLWFLIGPALFHWLVFNREPSRGVRWMVGWVPHDQTEVWKLAEVGLRNSPYILHSDAFYRGFDECWGSFGISVTSAGGPDGPACVSSAFAWYDQVISDTVQSLVQWTGILNFEGDNSGSGYLPGFLSSAGAYFGFGLNLNSYDPKNTPKWDLLSDMKWQVIENVTSSKLYNLDMRDAFTHFIVSECGDAMIDAINPELSVNAANSNGEDVRSVYYQAFAPSIGSTLSGIGQWGPSSMFGDPLSRALEAQSIPQPRSVRKLISNEYFNSINPFTSGASGAGSVPGGLLPGSSGGLSGSLGSIPLPGGGSGAGSGTSGSGYDLSPLKGQDYISCSDYLILLMRGFRVEAGITYNQVVNIEPANEVKLDQMANYLTYGWRIKDNFGEPSTVDRQEFIKNLILSYMFRNELSMMPRVDFESQITGSEKIVSDTEIFQRDVNQKSKYGEIYVWAKMMPYFQGVTLYLLALAYPFACMLMVIPGMHKMLFTWMGFWAWVKLWDVGFAVVMLLERSIWAMLGVGSQAEGVNSLVAEITTSGLNSITINNSVVPAKVAVKALGNGVDELHKAMDLFDRLTLLSLKLDLDVTNSYYIYIMSALYFAVPAVVGQIVLGSKSWAAGQISQAVSGIASESGRAAGSAATSDWQTRAHAVGAEMKQAGYAKALRQSGMGAGYLGLENQGGFEAYKSSLADQKGRLFEFGASNAGLKDRNLDMGLSAVGAVLGSGAGKLGAAVPSALRYHFGQNYNGEQFAQNSKARGQGIEGFEASQNSARLRYAADRAKAAASFFAENETAAMERDWGSKMAASSAARGVLSGTFGVRGKPTDIVGMAMSGYLGEDAKNAGSFMSDGGTADRAIQEGTGSLWGDFGNAQGFYKEFADTDFNSPFWSDARKEMGDILTHVPGGEWGYRFGQDIGVLPSSATLSDTVQNAASWSAEALGPHTPEGSK